MESSFDNYRVEKKEEGFYLIINEQADELKRARQALAQARVDATRHRNLYFQFLELFKRGTIKETL